MKQTMIQQISRGFEIEFQSEVGWWTTLKPFHETEPFLESGNGTSSPQKKKGM